MTDLLISIGLLNWRRKISVFAYNKTDIIYNHIIQSIFVENFDGACYI